MGVGMNSLSGIVKSLALLIATVACLAVPASAAAGGGPAIKVTTVRVTHPGNPSAAIVPFTDAVYQSCDDAPSGSTDCQDVGGVDYRYGIGELEVTVKQWVDFLNTADPTGNDPHNLYDPTESSTAWPKYGQVNESDKARDGRHYSVAFPEWADKPYGFATFLRAARFTNSLYNGRLLSKRVTSSGRLRLRHLSRAASPREPGRGMYDLRRNKRTGATRAHAKGFVVPSQDEWIKAAYYDPTGGGTYSYWKYPTNAGVFGDGTATAPSPTTLDPSTGDVTNPGTQPLATYHASGLPAPTWCPAGVQPQSDCSTVNPLRHRSDRLRRALPGQPRHGRAGD